MRIKKKVTPGNLMSVAQRLPVLRHTQMCQAHTTQLPRFRSGLGDYLSGDFPTTALNECTSFIL